MKNLLKQTLLTIVAASAILSSVQAESFTQRIQVTSSEPVYSEVAIPAKYKWEQVCEDVWVEDTRNNSNNQYNVSHNETIGTLIGGAIGNRLGSGGHSDRKAFGTILGAVIGNKIGSDYNNETYSNSSSGHYVSRCSRVRVKTSESKYETRLVGYKLTGVFAGKTITKRTRNNQNYIQVRITY